MPEVKSVKVDNWGVFFLQKLQNFFNKTDYCDLTLQFKDNSQLKVHRLVLSACTDFFNVLEQRYNVTDDILIMPRDLQADVVVPIVNFMYTGTLEFEMQMYGRLLKTAKDMNMTVLLKLLEAHKRTVSESRSQSQNTPVLLNKGARPANTYSRPSAAPSSATQRTYVQRRPVAAARTSPSKPPFGAVVTKIKTEKGESSAVRGLPTTSYLRKNLPEPVQLVAKYANSSAAATARGPSRFECSDDTNLQETFESSFDNISYESKPLITASQVKEEDFDATAASFEQLKRSYTGTSKRPNTGPTQAPPPKKEKPDLQEIKEFAEATRLRKEIVAEEFENEPAEYDGDDYQSNDDDDDEQMELAGGSIVASDMKSPGGSVIIKSDSGNPVNHAKIISEVLKKYPHLVKNKNNIKLKIMQKQKGGQSVTTTAAIAKEPQPQPKPIAIRAAPTKGSPGASSKCTQPAKPAVAPSNQPKKIDSRTMHALIAKGAENMTGPWLCLECGVSGRPISIPSYKGFRRHLISVHRQKIDPRLCEHCGWRSTSRKELHYHALVDHTIKPPQEMQFPKCGLCSFVALDQPSLRRHKEEDHQNQSSQQTCIYCNKTFAKEISLYHHMRAHHKERAQEDGVMDFSDDEAYEDDGDKYVPNHPELEPASTSTTADNKIKVLSNITLPGKSAFVLDSSATGTIISADNLTLEPSSEAEGLSNVASGIATSLGVLDSTAQGEAYQSEDDPTTQFIEAELASVHGETLPAKKAGEERTDVVTKFITEEGSELQLTAAQKAELLEQLQGQGDGLTENVVMVLNDGNFEQLVYGDGGHEQPSELKGEEGSHVAADETQNDSMDWNTATESEEDADPLKNDESQPEIEPADGDTSAENLENIQACITNSDSVDEEAGNDETKDNDQKDAQPTKDSKPNQLISALEGDWSDEEDEREEKSHKSASSKTADESHDVLVTTVTRGSKPASKDTKKKSDTSVSNLLLDDWNDSQQSGKDADGDADADGDGDDEAESVEKDEKDPKTEDEEDIPQKKSAKSTATGKKGKSGEKAPDSAAGNNGRSATSKAEIKTLINNDWGDDEDDAF